MFRYNRVIYVLILACESHPHVTEWLLGYHGYGWCLGPTRVTMLTGRNTE
jgi:hypothetical protein